MANTISEKELKTNWPNEEGLTARTQKQTGRQMNLLPEGLNGIKTVILERDKELM